LPNSYLINLETKNYHTFINIRIIRWYCNNLLLINKVEHMQDQLETSTRLPDWYLLQIFVMGGGTLIDSL